MLFHHFQFYSNQSHAWSPLSSKEEEEEDTKEKTECPCNPLQSNISTLNKFSSYKLQYTSLT